MAAVAPLLSSISARAASSSLEPLTTGISNLDARIGGIPRASMTEIWGTASSGRTSLLQSLLRTTMANGQYAAWIDTPDTFDPQTAALGWVRLSQLLWVRCHRQPEHALQAADLLVRAGGFALVILDLSGTAARITNRIPMATWFRLRHGAEHSGTALLVMGETSNTGSCSRLKLTLKQDRILWSNQLLQGTCVATFDPKRGRQETSFFSTSL